MIQLRKQKGLTQDALAKTSKLTRQTIGAYEVEDGTDPGLPEFCRLIEALGTWSAFLLDESDSPEPPSKSASPRSFRLMTTRDTSVEEVRLVDLRLERIELLEQEGRVIGERKKILDEEIKALEETIRSGREPDERAS